MDNTELNRIAGEIGTELRGHILPFWLGLKDERGGFFGQVAPDLTRCTDAPKGTLLHARILWAFSAAYQFASEQTYLSAAAHAYTFLRRAWDVEHGGFFWSLNADGTPAETEKYALCNAFCINGLVRYAEASGDKDALERARGTFSCIESHFAAPHGYAEVMSADWLPLANDRLSGHGLYAARTTNTALHLLDAYASLYRLTLDEAVGNALKKLILLFSDRIYQPDAKQLGVYFDADMNVLGDLHSYGLDMQASSQLNRACEILGDDALTEKMRAISYQLADSVSRTAFFDGALSYERFGAEIDRKRIWRVQTEGVIGCMDAAKTAKMLGDDGNADRLLNLAAALWNYIQGYQIDRREGGEWFAETDPKGMPLYSADIAGTWKGPYHNSRMCLEVIDRIRHDFA